MLVQLALFLLVALGIAYITIQYMRKPPFYMGKQALYDLSIPQQRVLDNEDLPWSTEACALRFGIFISQAPRTLSKVDCIVPPERGFKPSCPDFEFVRCDCSTTDCTSCSLPDDSTGYLSKLVYIGDNLEFWASGYTSENDKPLVPALLKIRTAKDNQQHSMEAVNLPAIPLQRWTIITIVKEGRRIDVYYGAKHVTGKLLDYIPVTPDSSRQWYAGNAGWKGQIGFFSGIRHKVTGEDVLKDVSSIVNTRGEPTYTDYNLNVFSVKMPECILGNCNTMPVVRPLNPFAVYSSSVS